MEVIFTHDDLDECHAPPNQHICYISFRGNPHTLGVVEYPPTPWHDATSMYAVDFPRAKSPPTHENPKHYANEGNGIFEAGTIVYRLGMLVDRKKEHWDDDEGKLV